LYESELLKIKHPNEKDLRKFLKYYELESNVFMPNEIFDDLHKKFKELFPSEESDVNNFVHIVDKNGKKRKKRPDKNTGVISSHIAFSYSYYYFITWLYRYSTYDKLDITTNGIKKSLGYSPTTKTIDFIIKKNGVMDDLGYTLTTTNYPVMWDIDENGDLEFTYLQQLDPMDIDRYQKIKGRNYKVKHPIKHFHRSKESEEDDLEDGVFFDVQNTHLVEFEVFLFCMGKKELGCIAFYLYCYLMRMNGHFGGGYDVSLPNLAKETVIKERTLDKYLTLLKKYRMISFKHNQQYFVPGLGSDKRKANTYITNPYTAFSDSIVPIKKIEKMSLEKYEEMMLERENQVTNQEVDEGMWGLPSNL
jgi:hypothetical protein